MAQTLMTLTGMAAVAMSPKAGAHGELCGMMAIKAALTARGEFSIVIAGKKVPGSITWADHDTVLVFKPAKVLAKGSGVGVRLLGTATSADGVPIKKGGSATFKVVEAPSPKPASTKRAAMP